MGWDTRWVRVSGTCIVYLPETNGPRDGVGYEVGKGVHIV
jgi:hypothetical protein